jgi:3-oxoacyl-[acyl-carrier protein] reductase
MRLQGKRAVVTGSSQGIGRAVALRLAKEGADVVINGTGSVPGMLEGVAAQIDAIGRRVVPVVGSVADVNVGKQLIQTCVEAFGGIDILINVAGISGRNQGVLTVTHDVWHEQINVHLNGTFYTCREAAPMMAAQGHGTIVNTSSHAIIGIFGGTGYGAAKAATNSLTYELAYDLQAYGVRVNAIAPGARTQMSSGAAYEAGIKELVERGLMSPNQAPLPDRSQVPGPEHVASVYAWLASDMSAPITGRVLTGSGGKIGYFPNPVDVLLGAEDFAEGQTWSLEQIQSQLQALPELAAPLPTNYRPTNASEISAS